MAKQSQKSRDKNTEILQVINKCYPLLLSLTFREFHKVAAAMANVLMPYWQRFPRGTTSRF